MPNRRESMQTEVAVEAAGVSREGSDHASRVAEEGAAAVYELAFDASPIDEDSCYQTKIKVIGVGGGARLAVESMIARCKIEGNWSGVELIEADTDSALAGSAAQRFLHLGVDTRGAPRTVEEGCCGAEHVVDNIRGVIEGAQMLFVLVVLGGNTGTGAAPVITRVAREMGVFTVVCAVTEPFQREDYRNMTGADASLAELDSNADAVVVMRYGRLLDQLGGQPTIDTVVAHANNTLANFVRDTAFMLNVMCHVGVDFEDVRTVLGLPGKMVVGAALARGPDRARIAARRAIASPLMGPADLALARGVLALISGAQGKLLLTESKAVLNAVRDAISPEADIIYGTTYDNELGDAIRVTIVVSGLISPTSLAFQGPAARRTPAIGG